MSSEEDAREIIAQVKAEHPRARHHCTAFVIGSDGRVQRSSDDGEPSGTAGAPMFDALVSAGLSDIVAVVTRYFGGVLLGAGGLTRRISRSCRRSQLLPHADSVVNSSSACEHASQIRRQRLRLKPKLADVAM